MNTSIWRRRIAVVLSLAVLSGCAGVQRSCSSWRAGSFGADWIVVQLRADGTPVNCWQLRNTSIDNESQSDGIYWLDPHHRHLVHISGWYNRVQVSNGDFAQAAGLLGVELDRCEDGRYSHSKE